MNQKHKILEHLKKKPLTQLEATLEYGILRLSERVRELKRDGYNIISERVVRGRKRYARYWLLPTPKNTEENPDAGRDDTQGGTLFNPVTGTRRLYGFFISKKA